MDKELWWYPDEELVWVPVTIARKDGVRTATTIDGRDIVVPEDLGSLSAVHPSALIGMSNMIHLEDLSEGVILHTLRDRYKKNEIYTYISSIVVSINPYQKLPIYGPAALLDVKNRGKPTRPGQPKPKPTIDPKEPHVYVLAADVHKALVSSGHSQAVIISGESGAGKTEATKFILEYLSFLSSDQANEMSPEMRMIRGKPEDQEARVEDQIVAANPIIEALGNAKTVRNDNSSRFGKWIEIHFDSQHTISGGSIAHYLLEKSRVVQQSPGERNYHIFYRLCAVRETDERIKKYELGGPEDYAFLGRSKDYTIREESDAKGWETTLRALRCLKFSQSEINFLCDCIVAILYLGNITITAPGGNEDKAAVEDNGDLQKCAKLMGVAPSALSEQLISEMKSFDRKTFTRMTFKYQQALSNRDALGKHMYGKLFDWVMSRINSVLRTAKYVFGVIGVLDIFGFEIFETNRFEQFLINFANEKLQKHFNHFVFELEQEEYKAQGLKLPYIEFKDNTACLKLIEHPPTGIIPLLDEELKLPKGSDETFLEKTQKSLIGNQNYIKPKVKSPTFGIKHYAGEVWYEVAGFLEKNKDKLSDGLVGMLEGSGNELFQQLFKEKDDDAPVVSGSKPSSTQGHDKPKIKTLASLFKEQLRSLMDKLESTQPHFVRCIKPNGEKEPNNFNSQQIIRQLRYAGIQAVIEVRKQGYPFRLTHRDFFRRFKLLCPGIEQPDEDTPTSSDLVGEETPFGKASVALLNELKVEPTAYGIGFTKVFLTHEKHMEMESLREGRIKIVAIILQARRRSVLIRRKYLVLLDAKRELQDILSVSKTASLQDQLSAEFLSRVEEGIENANKLKIPLCLDVYKDTTALSNMLVEREMGRRALVKVVETATEDVSIYDEALKAAVDISEDLKTLREYKSCEKARLGVILLLEQRRLQALKEAEEARERELQLQREKELLEEKRVIFEEEMRVQARQRAEAALAAAQRAAQEAADREAMERAIALESPSAARLKKPAAKKPSKKKTTTPLSMKSPSKSSRNKEDPDLATPVGRGESALVEKLRRRIQQLEKEKEDQSTMYKDLNESLFEKLAEAGTYKKKVQTMEMEYVRRIQKLQAQNDMLNQATQAAYEENKKQRELDAAKNFGDLKAKCDQLAMISNELHQAQELLHREQMECQRLRGELERTKNEQGKALKEKDDYVLMMERSLSTLTKENKAMKSQLDKAKGGTKA